MLLEVCREINNFFINPNQVEYGEFKIEDGIIRLDSKYLVGQHIALTGSILHNGVYLLTDDLYTIEGASNEEFEGEVYGLIIPKDFLILVSKIEEFHNNPQNRATTNVSESFGIDSRSRATNKNGVVARWQDVFRNDLNKHRLMFSQISI